MCDTCCCCCQQRPSPGNGGDGKPPPSRCLRYQVTIESIDVSKIDDGFLGGTLETTWTIVVNGQPQIYTNNNLDVGVTPIGFTFFAAVPADSSTITVQVSGVEDDPFFDDTLPGFTDVWGQAENWGVGAQSNGGSDSNITYRLNYTITCAERTTISVSRAALRAYGEAKASQRPGAGRPDPLVAESWALDRFRRFGQWEAIASTSDTIVLSGYGTLPVRVQRQFGEGREEQKDREKQE
jgi:hypothetical protein